MASDSHTWNLVFLQLVLTELGCRVTNLGACAPDDLIVKECRRRRPDLVVVSSVNGHGYRDGMRVIALLREQPELVSTPVVIGGKLGIGNDRVGASLLRAGFDAVFEEGTDLDLFRSYVASLRSAVPR
jgi:methylaspartate mutase sigma subunit